MSSSDAPLMRSNPARAPYFLERRFACPGAAPDHRSGAAPPPPLRDRCRRSAARRGRPPSARPTANPTPRSTRSARRHRAIATRSRRTAHDARVADDPDRRAARLRAGRFAPDVVKIAGRRRAHAGDGLPGQSVPAQDGPSDPRPPRCRRWRRPRSRASRPPDRAGTMTTRAVPSRSRSAARRTRRRRQPRPRPRDRSRCLSARCPPEAARRRNGDRPETRPTGRRPAPRRPRLPPHPGLVSIWSPPSPELVDAPRAEESASQPPSDQRRGREGGGERPRRHRRSPDHQLVPRCAHLRPPVALRLLSARRSDNFRASAYGRGGTWLRRARRRSAVTGGRPSVCRRFAVLAYTRKLCRSGDRPSRVTLTAASPG